MAESSNKPLAASGLAIGAMRRCARRPMLVVVAVLGLAAPSDARAGDPYTQPTTYTYKTVGDLPIKADVYRLPGDDVRPVIAWIHGGGLITGSRGGPAPAQRKRYLDAGYVIVSIDYRLAPETKLPGIIDDVRDAIAWIRAEGPGLYKIDPARLAVVGHSAGGYLTLMAGLAVEPRPRALVAFYGYGDVDGDWYAKPSEFHRKTRPPVTREEAYQAIGTKETTISVKGRSSFYTYCRQNGLWSKLVVGFDPVKQPREFDRFCPVRNVTRDYPPTLLLHGDKDTDVPYEQSVAMAAELKRAGVAHEFITIEGGGHGFDAKGLDDPDVSAAFDRIETFLKERTGDRDRFFQPPPEYTNELGGYRSPLQFYDGRRVKTADDWPARRQEILDRWHSVMGPWPPVEKKPKIEYLAEERRDNFTQYHIRLQIAPDRFTDDAYLLKPDGSGPFPAVVVVYYESQTGIGRGKAPLRDFAYQLARRGFVSLSLGSPPGSYYPSENNAQLQPLSFHAYVAANCWHALANLPDVDARRIGIVGHSYGGKWAMFASCLYDRFACAAWSDGGIVFDETRGNVNYWEPWYLGHEPGKPQRQKGIPTPENPRTGAYKTLVEQGLDLHELHALMAPRPFLVSGGAEDPPERWRALNHAIAVNTLLGYTNRVAMTNRGGHPPTPESNEQIYQFFERFLGGVPPGPRN